VHAVATTHDNRRGHRYWLLIPLLGDLAWATLKQNRSKAGYRRNHKISADTAGPFWVYKRMMVKRACGSYISMYDTETISRPLPLWTQHSTPHHAPVSASLILSSSVLNVIGLILPQSKSLMQTKSLLSLPDRKHITQTDKIIWQSLIHFDIKVIIQQHVHIYTRYIYKGIAIRWTSQMCVYVCTCGCMHPCEHMYVHIHICISYEYLSMHIILFSCIASMNVFSMAS
jgi:hypothetical protein